MKNPLVVIFVCACAMPAIAVDWSTPDAVVQAVIDANPKLGAITAQIDAAKERVASASSLPNPMLMGGVQNKPIDLSADFMTMYMIGASQTFVRKSRRDALRRGAELDVERLQREFDSQRTEVERDVRLAYDEAAATQNQIAVSEAVANLVKLTVDASRLRYETGSAPQADMIRSMLEESTIRHQVLALRRQRAVAIARLLALLNLPLDTTVPAFALEQEMRHHHEQPLQTALPDTTAAVASLQADVARAEEDIKLAKLAATPDFNLEASYGVRPGFRDMFSVVGRIELPIRRSSIIEPRIREAIARRNAAQQEIAAVRQRLSADLGAAIALRDEAIEQIDLHVDRLVPEARLGFESALASYQNGKTTLDAVLGSLQALRTLNADYYDFLKQQLEAEIDIDALRRGARSGASSGSMNTAAPMSVRPQQTPAGTASMQVR